MAQLPSLRVPQGHRRPNATAVELGYRHHPHLRGTPDHPDLVPACAAGLVGYAAALVVLTILAHLLTRRHCC